MKRYLISMVAALVVLMVVWAAFGQRQAERRQRWAQWRGAQLKAIEAIQEQVGKLKADLQDTGRRDRKRFQDLSDEEKAKLREKWTNPVVLPVL